MTTAALLSELRRRDIRLVVEGERLRALGPKGAITPELQQELAARKTEILAILGQKTPQSPLRRIPRDGRLPLSYGQERLWFLHQLEPDSVAHNIFSAIRFQQPLDVPAIERCLTTLIERHEVLRTSFEMLDGEPAARVHEPAAVTLPVADLRTLTALERDEEAARLKRELAAAWFDLARLPLCRFMLVRLSEREWELLVAQHHIITDRWSLGVLMSEVQELYTAFSTGREPALAPLPMQYVDYAQWQRDADASAALAQQATYWRQRLAGALPVIDLPTDRPRPATQTYNGSWESRLVPESLNVSLRTLSQQEGATLYMTALAAFKALLSRYTGVEDILVGSPIAGRSREEFEPLIGLFINTLVLRTDVSGNPTFRQLLARVRDTALDAYAHQDVPFERIVGELHLPRDLSRSPVFQVVFVFHNAPKRVEVKSDVALTSSGGTMFDMTLSLVEVKDGLLVTAEYNTDLFDRQSIARVLAGYESLLAAVVADPDTRLLSLPLAPASESAERLRLWQGPVLARPSAATVAAAIAAQAARTPEALAVGDGTTTLTYAALEAQSTAVAQRLRAAGVDRGARVGVCVERSAAMVVALLGVWKADAAYVPLDPAFPRERLAYMLADAGVQAVVQDAASAASLPPHPAAVVALESATVPHDAAAPRPARAGGDDVAYVIYTSGSTGQPKGVAVPHRAVLNFLASMAATPGLTASDVLVAVTTLSFDIAGLELWLPLTVGARVEIATRAEAADGRLLQARLVEAGATVLQATPATWRLLLEAGWTGGPGLRMLCGGEALPRELAAALVAGGGPLWNLYGPTETTIWSTVEPVTAAAPVTIGRPIAQTQAYVRDAAGQSVPVGVLGELYLGGAGLAHGYLGQPALTAERFVPDPFSGAPGARLYRTGDVARWRADGRLQCLGRVDHQVKVRGFRIELGEIETALAAHPAIRAAVVTAQPDATGTARLVAYFVSDREAPTTSDLRRFLRKTLPDYMVPSLFMGLDALPLTQNRKVDRLALPRTFGAPEPGAGYIAPRTATEQRIAAVWQEVLGIERVSMDANFFDVGGHSLLAMKVIGRIEAALGLRLNPRVLMLDTLEQIATACDRRFDAAAGTGSRTVQPLASSA